MHSVDEDFVGVTTLFAIFGAALLLYGFVLFRTGNKDLLPLRAQYSVRGKADVMRVGKYVLIIGAILLVVMLVAILLKPC